MSTYVAKRAAELDIKVVDAKKPLVIQVTPIDVAKAEQKNSKCCAFVRSAERSVPGVRAAFFFRTKAYLEYDDKIVRYDLPPSVQKEIVSFDRSRNMEAGTYQLSAPGPTETLAGKLKRRDEQRSHAGKNGKGKGVKIGLRHRTTNVRTLVEPTYRASK